MRSHGVPARSITSEMATPSAFHQACSSESPSRYGIAASMLSRNPRGERRRSKSAIGKSRTRQADLVPLDWILPLRLGLFRLRSFRMGLVLGFHFREFLLLLGGQDIVDLRTGSLVNLLHLFVLLFLAERGILFYRLHLFSLVCQNGLELRFLVFG